MIYIDKHPNITEGESFTRDYLVDSFDEESHRFLPSLKDEEAFNMFRNHETDFKSLLLREQDGRCCYCMCRIGADTRDSNIEHLIPKKSPVSDLPYYAKYSDLLNHHVCHSETFESKYHADKKSVGRSNKLPHMVAYENLVASCVDPNHCNSARGNAKIPPLPIIRDIENKLFYSKTGRSVSIDEEDENADAIGILRLNFPLLEQIRLLWRKASESAYDVDQILGFKDVTEKQNFLCTLLGARRVTELNSKWQNFAPVGENSATHYWELFVKYDWFYDYYKNHDKFGNRI